MKKGSLTIVGTGLITPAHLSQESISYIKSADVVHFLIPDPLGKSTVEILNSNIKNLGEFYFSGNNRLESYNMMVDSILSDVRKDKDVCVIFYGHPGVFVYPSHESIRQAKLAGYQARMLPAISAEDCLVADLGIDPGYSGCQHFECSQFMFYQHSINIYSSVILWQLGVVGDDTMSTTLKPAKNGLIMLKESLLNWYPEDHEVTVYEAATLPLMPARIETVQIGKLESIMVNPITTLYIPPLSIPPINIDFCKRWNINIS